MDSYSVQAVLSVKDKGFTSGMQSASSAVQGVDSSTQKSSKSVGALGTAFAVANKVISGACSVIKSSVSDAVARVDTLNNYPKIMEQMGFTSEEAEKSINKLSDGIQGLPTSLDSIVSSAQNIALISGNLSEATDVALALNDAFLASGASTDEAERGVEAYDKMLSTGKVNQQNWMTLQQNMGYALSEVAKQLGITSGNTSELYTAMQEGSITFDEFNAALVTCDTTAGGFAETASVACDGIATSWQNVKTAVVRGVANMIQAWNDAANDNSLPTIQESLHTLQSVVDKCFSVASKAITVFVNNLDTIVAACIPVVAAIAGLKVIQTVTKMIDKFKTKSQESVKVLQNWDDNMDRAKQASKNLETAQKNLTTAQEKCRAALTKANDATEKYEKAQAKVVKAEEKKADALKKSNSATEDSEQAAKDLQQAEDELAQAEKDAKAAAEASKTAHEEYAAEKKNVAEADNMVTDCQNEQATAMQNVSTKAILQSAMMNVLSGEMNIAKAAMEAFNAACEANPLGVVVTAVTTVISAMSALKSALKKAGIMAEDTSDRWKDLKENLDDLYDSLEESDKEMQTNIDNLAEDKANVEKLWAQIKNLASYEELSADQSSRLNDYIYQLNETVPGLGLAIDDATGSLTQGMDAVDAYIGAWEALSELSVVTDEYTQALQNQADVHTELKDAQEEYQRSTEEMGDLSAYLTGCTGQNIIAYIKEKKAVEELEEEDEYRTEEAKRLADEREAAVVTASNKLAEAYNAEVENLKAAVEADTISYDDLSEANQSMVDDIKGNYDDLVDAAHNMSEEIATEDDKTAQDYIDTLTKNNEALEGWGTNMDTLRQRFEELHLDDAVLDDFAAMGEDGIPMVADFVDASDEQLEELVKQWSETGTDAWDSGLKPALGAAADQIPSSVEEYITTPLDKSLSDQLADVDWAEPCADLMDSLWDSMSDGFDNLDIEDLGISIDEGVASGIHKEMKQPSDGINDVFTNLYKSGKSAIDMGSPAGEYIPMGESIDEGIAKGLRDSESVVTNAAKRIIREVEKTFNSLGSSTTSGINKMTAAFKSGMSVMQSTTSTGMSAIKSVINSGMTNVSSAINAGMTKAKAAMTSGMNSIKSAVTSAMNSMASSVTNGMNSMNNAMRNGMNSVSNTARSISNSITSQFNGLYNDLYNSGAHAMNGLMAGLISRQGAVMNTAQNIANSVTNTINSALQVGSPSKVMKKTGRYVGEGLVLGIKSMIGDVEDVAADMANAVNSMVFDSPKLAFEGGVDLNASYAFDNEELLGALDDIKDALGDSTYEFTIPFSMDGREFARAQASYTQDRQDKLQGRTVRRDKFLTGE